MIEHTVEEGLVWMLIVLVGIGTYALRLSFIHLRGWADEFPVVVEQSLTYLPEAVLAAFIFPALFTLNGTVVGMVNSRVLAASLAVVVAWRTRSMLATIVIGIGALWLASYLIG